MGSRVEMRREGGGVQATERSERGDGQCQRRRGGDAQRADSSAMTLEQPRRAYVTTLSEGESRLTAWYQRGGGGRVQAPRFLSLHKRHRPRPSFPKAICAAVDPRAPKASGHICFVPSRAGQSSISFVPDTLAVGPNLKRNTSKTEDSLCNRIQLEGVNLSPVAIWEN